MIEGVQEFRGTQLERRAIREDRQFIFNEADRSSWPQNQKPFARDALMLVSGDEPLDTDVLI